MSQEKPTRIQMYIAMSGTFAIAFIGGASGWYLASETTQRDYLTNVLLSFSAGLLVSLIFTLIIQNILSRQSAVEMSAHQRISTVTGLYERFHSPEMIEIRCRLDRFLKNMDPDAGSLNTIYQKLYINGGDLEEQRDWVALSTILHFYENLASLIENDLIDQPTAVTNFRNYYRWLRESPSLKSAIESSKKDGETWFFISKFQFLEEHAGF